MVPVSLLVAMVAVVAGALVGRNGVGRLAVVAGALVGRTGVGRLISRRYEEEH